LLQNRSCCCCCCCKLRNRWSFLSLW